MPSVAVTAGWLLDGAAAASCPFRRSSTAPSGSAPASSRLTPVAQHVQCHILAACEALLQASCGRAFSLLESRASISCPLQPYCTALCNQSTAPSSPECAQASDRSLSKVLSKHVDDILQAEERPQQPFETSSAKTDGTHQEERQRQSMRRQDGCILGARITSCFIHGPQARSYLRRLRR